MIRESTGEYWVPEREEYISHMEEFAIRNAIESNLNVIIDATNLNPKTVNKWYKLKDDLSDNYDITLEFKKFTISYEEALKRDEERGKNGGRSVGKKTIERFFKTYYPQEYKEYYTDPRLKQPFYPISKDKINCIIVDLDGTVALHNGRYTFDWSRIPEDKPNIPLINMITNLNLTYHVIFLTGREETEECRKNTEEWIRENFYDNTHCNESLAGWHLIMRKKKDFRHGDIVKEELFHNEIEPKYNVIAAFDDSDKIVRMWRNLGILCCQVYNLTD